MKVRQLMSMLSRCDPDLEVYVQDANCAVADKLECAWESVYNTEDYWEGGGITEELADGTKYVVVGA